MENTEKLIVEQLKRGTENAYKYIYDHHYVPLCHVAKGYLHDDFLTETIVGDVIFHLWEIRDSLEISISLRAYLMRAVRNRCLNHLKLEYEQREVSFSTFPAEEFPEKYILSDNYPLGTLLERELEDKVHSAISRLPKECRTIFMKSRFDNKKYETIAQELEISINTVKYHIKNALSLLQEDLGKYLIFLLFFFDI